MIRSSSLVYDKYPNGTYFEKPTLALESLWLNLRVESKVC